MSIAALRRTVVGLADPPDAALLRRFAADRSGEAFAALVRRHGPLVLGVCRRAVRDAHLAEDAFQAVFVVLARRAGDLDPARPLAAWLHGVAVRVARRARAVIARRHGRETLTAAPPDVPDGSPVPDDLAAVLDEEIGRLSTACREAVVLCELQGVSRREAAAKLGIAEGTLSSRLAAARKTLAAALRTRGVAPFAVGAVSAELVAATVSSATGTVPPLVSSLADGASAMTLFHKLTAAAVVGVLLLAGGFGPWRANQTAAAPVPKPKPDGELLWVQNDITFELKAYSPDGKLVKEVKLPEGHRFLGVTPDGRKIAFAGKKGKVVDPKESEGLTVHLRDIGIGTDTEGADTGLDYQPHDHLVWSADAGRVVRGRATDPAAPAGDMTYSLYDLDTRKQTDLKLPTSQHVMQWSPDGTWLLIYSGEELFSPNRLNWSKFDLSDGKATPIATHFPCFRADLSPDGKSMIGYVHRVVKENGEPRHDYKLVRVDVNTGVETALSRFTEPTGCGPGWGRWSPDGNRLAFWCEVRDTTDDSRRMHLSVCDADTGERNAVAVLPHNSWVLLGWFPAQKVKAPVPKPAPPEGVLLAGRLNVLKRAELVEVIGTDGKGGGQLDLGELDNVQQVRVSPDGKRLAFVRFVPLTAKQFGRVKRQPQYAYPQNEVYVVDLPLSGPPKEPLLKDLLEPSVAWAADGQSLYVSRIPAGTDTDPGERKGKLVPKETVRYDLATRKETAVQLPDGHTVLDAAADGKTLLTGTCVWDPSVVARSTYLVPLDTLKPKLLGDEDDGFDRARLSPDGTRVVGTRVAFSKSTELGLFVADVAKGTVTPVPVEKEVADGLFNGRVSWAPDGKRLAVLWAGPSGKALPGGGGPSGGGGRAKKVTVLDATGENARTVCEFADDSVLDLEWAAPMLTDPKKDEPKAKAPGEPIKAPVPKEKADGGLIWTNNVKTHALTAYTPDGKVAKEITLPADALFLGLTADGTRMTFAGTKGKATHEPGDELTLHVGDISEKCEGADTGLGWQVNDQFVWSPDGRRVVRARLDQRGVVPPGGGLTPPEYSHVLYDLDTKKETKLALPADHQVMQWSADGKSWRVLQNNLGQDPKLPSYRWLTTPTGDKPDLKPICDTGSFLWLDPMPDGKGFLGVGGKHVEGESVGAETLFRVAGGKADEVVKLDGVAFAAARRSPDGKRIACLKYQLDGPKKALGDSVLVVFDADGTNETELHTAKGDGQNTHLLGWFPPPGGKAGAEAKPWPR